MKRLTDVLKGREHSSVTPFFWQHGETKELLSEYMDKIHASGCGGVCVEARPHPDFVKEKWWEDVGHIMKEAKKKQKVTDVKEIRISPNIDSNDLSTKVNAARKFIEKGDKVKVTLRFRGREMAHMANSKVILDVFAEKLVDIAVVEKPAKLEGRSMQMVLAGKR